MTNFAMYIFDFCFADSEFRAVARALIGGGGVYSYIQVPPD